MATNWMEQNTSTSSRAAPRNALVTFITIGLIVFVAALNILISLIMMGDGKTRDIAILMSDGHAQGAGAKHLHRPRRSDRSVLAPLSGLLLGYANLLCGRPLPRDFSIARGLYSIDYVPFAPRPMDGVLGSGGSNRSVVRSDALSLLVRRQNPAGGSLAATNKVCLRCVTRALPPRDCVCSAVEHFGGIRRIFKRKENKGAPCHVYFSSGAYSFVFCWPLALLALVAYPFVWLLLLPFRIRGVAVHGVLEIIFVAITLPFQAAGGAHFRNLSYNRADAGPL